MLDKLFKDEETLMLVGIAAVIFYIWRSGGIANAAGSAAQAIGETVANTAANVVTGGVTGVVTGVSNATGLPTPAQTTTDKYVARYIMDHPAGGQMAASAWSSAAAYVGAQFLPQYSGHAPQPGTAIYAQFPPDAAATTPPPVNDSASGSGLFDLGPSVGVGDSLP